jgi:hypothetical protein
MKRIYVEWDDDCGLRRNGNMIGPVAITRFEDGQVTIDTGQIVKAELRETNQDALDAKLRAFGRDCVNSGGMTPDVARMLNRILDERNH